MFKKFRKEDVTARTLAKTSVQRNIRKDILDAYPMLEEELEKMVAKKAPMYIAKCPGYSSLIISDGLVHFFQIRDKHVLPTLRTLHMYPDLLPKVQVDQGAIRFVLKGADIMCPGLTSAGGSLPDGIAAGTPVAVMAEGKQHAVAIGVMKLSSADIKRINKDIGIETVHYLNDGLWTLERFD